MSDQDDPSEHDDVGHHDEPRTEGVRIIGAQEAAEAAGRPDVARRRRRGEKGFGDRPDEPAVSSDLPRITISTTEPDPGDAGRFGAAPTVRPGEPLGPEVAHPPADEPRWADEEQGFAAVPPADARPSFGHARVVDESAQAGEPSWSDESDTSSQGSWGGEPSWSEEPSWSDQTDIPSTAGGYSDQEYAAGDLSSGYPPAEPMERRVSYEPPEPDDETRLLGDEDAGGDFAEEFAEDESFVLPHWTEPATGQVPKVVIGDEEPSSELASYGSQPRWRDEGDRTVETDFDDLIDHAPRLGALGSDEPVEEDYDEFFDSEVDRDPLGAFAPVDEEFEVERPRRAGDRRAAGGPRRGGGEGGEEHDFYGPGGGGGDRNLVMAVGVGVALLAVGLVCFSLGGLATTVLATVIVTAAGFEYYNAVREAHHNPATLLGLVSIGGLLLAAYFGGLSAYPVVLALAVMLGLLWYWWVTPGEGAVQNLGVTFLGVLWIGVLGSFATLFLGLGRVIEEADPDITSNPGIGVLIAAVVAAVSHDIGGYFIGRYLGKTPLSAASPNKTQEGLAGGVLVSVIVTVVVIGFGGIAPIGSDLARTFIFALVCALVAPLGDLTESVIKRDLAIKDMGTILPGHGGVLDRFDALLFVLPAAYFVTVLLDVWGDLGG